MIYHHLTRDRELLPELAAHQMQYAPKAAMVVAERRLRLFLDLRFSTASEELADEAERKVVAALERLETELDGRDYLAGERFSVADLTAASLLYPIVLPPQTPWRPSRMPCAWLEFNAAHGKRPALLWAAEMYRRHR